MNNTMAKKRMDTKKLTVLAMFVALGYLCLFVFRFKVQFLSFEIKDVFITISGFIFGPLTAVGVALAEALLEMFTLSDTGIYGAVMNFAGSASFAASASLVYKYRKSLYGAFFRSPLRHCCNDGRNDSNEYNYYAYVHEGAKIGSVFAYSHTFTAV